MEILFNNKRVEKFFANWIDVKKEIGSQQTKVLKRRYDALKANPTFLCVLQMASGKPEALQGNMKGLYKLNLTANWRVVFKPGEFEQELEKCEKVIIVGIYDYHGSKVNWKLR